ncbi:hypothetical protein MED121_21061 [Marinomonas sp. MED121]|uniref:hypothetical protein n=1 Tax=Marinomonas sp. MED121 TaxID=314277 RepID=UPI0000690A38|nr:hypothetical protein [Marinomonas sp. MED121]EAQ64100.1 hypothetical protein MED121_21061 [Marinomonas sp. MED121]
MQEEEITTMVCFHDLLGFGNMVSVSGGTLSSAVGEIAHKRIGMLRETVNEISNDFPDGTKLFQMNDSAIAVCDLDYNIGSMHIDSGSIVSQPPPAEVAKKALEFVCASSKLHQRTIQKESESKIGPAGRSFIVLGKRWPVKQFDDQVTDVPELQANLAYSEAYAADTAGSKLGFGGRAWDSIYINDMMWFLMSISKTVIPNEINNLNANLSCSPGVEFPQKIIAPKNNKPIEIDIFHRKRTFHCVMSHHAIGISDAMQPKV